MLSVGIRFGQGFDKSSIIKVMQSIPNDFEYDFLVIGSNPGGVACAREAKLAGYRTAIVRWKRFSPAEAEGFDEDLEKMAEALEAPDSNLTQVDRQNSNADSLTQADDFNLTAEKKTNSFKTFSTNIPKTKSENVTSPQISTNNSRKIRQSRLDLNNEFFKRGQQCRKLMHNATLLGDVIDSARDSGWRLSTTTREPSLNWNKMSEEVMDYVMKENWDLAAALSEANVEVIEGVATLINNHTVKIMHEDEIANEITSAVICIALPAECILPKDVAGAEDYGITCDDFIRINEKPGKTLVVGSLPEGLECAGIVAGFRFPVTVVSRSKILKSYDSEISQMLLEDLRAKGVVFMEKTTVTSIEITPDKKLLANFVLSQSLNDSSKNTDEQTKELFDTVLFAVGRKVFLENLNVTGVGIECEPNCHKIKTDGNDTTTVPNIYAVGDVSANCPEGFEASELAGRLLGKRLFQGESELMDYSLIPSVMYTPTEYAWVGISEDAALYRLGAKCVDVYYGYFKPLDFVIPPKKGQCFAKIIVFKLNDAVIGLHIFGSEAGEIIQGFAAAIRTGLTMTKFRTVVGVTATKAQEILKMKEIRTYKDEKELSNSY